MSRPTCLNQIYSAGDVGIEDVPHLIEVLIEEAVPQAVPRVGEQRLHRSAVGGGVEFVHAVKRGEIGLDGLDRCTEGTELLSGSLDGGLIGGDQQIESLFGAAFGQFVADASRRARHHGEWTCV
jgi:hypothetical protein